MKYYLITSSEYQSHTTATTQEAAWSLDESKCIIEVEDDYTISNHIEEFSNSSECNDWRWSESTEEWRNWCTENFWNGSDLDDF